MNPNLQNIIAGCHGRVRPCRRPTHHNHHRRGSVMMVAIMTLLILTATALLLASAMRVENTASANHAEAIAANAAAEGAVRYAISILAQSPGRAPLEEDLRAQGVIVGNAAYWLIRPNRTGEGLLPGIADEGGKLSLNHADVETLIGLPGVTLTMAEAVVAWRTPGAAEEGLAGAGSQHYLMKDPPYTVKESPLESVEELLFIQDWTREHLFGNDRNRDGRIDTATTTSAADRGLYDLLTAHSSEPAVQQPININAQNLTDLQDLLREHLDADRFAIIWPAIPPQRPFRSALEFFVNANLTAEEFALIADRLVTSSATTSRSRINVNTADERVLTALPGLEQGDAATLVLYREGRDPDDPDITWVVDALGPEKAIEIGPYITGRSYQFTIDVVAIGATGRAFKRYRVVVDMTSTPARIVRWADWTELGWPLDPALRDALRNGSTLQEAVDMYGRIDR